MYLVFFLYLISLASIFSRQKDSFFFALGFSIAVSFDIYALPLGDKTVPLFYIYLFTFLIAHFKDAAKLKIVNFLRCPFFYIVALYFLIGLVSLFSAGPYNYSLYFKPPLVYFMWVAFSSVLIFNSYHRGFDVRSFLRKTVISISTLTLIMVFWEGWGLTMEFPVSSSTYELFNSRTWGSGYRPSGLTREPSHLIVIALFCAANSKFLRPHVLAFVLVCWFLIALLTEARSVMLGLGFWLIYLLISQRVFSLPIIFSIALGVLSLLVGDLDRLTSTFNVNSDESTHTRFGLIVAIVAWYADNWDMFNLFEDVVPSYCATGEIFRVTEFVCAVYPTMILNSTLHLVTAVPLPVMLPLMATFVFSFRRKAAAVIFFAISGMIFFVWAYPAVGLLILSSHLADVEGGRLQ